jgi:hypothetical protein
MQLDRLRIVSYHDPSFGVWVISGKLESTFKPQILFLLDHCRFDRYPKTYAVSGTSTEDKIRGEWSMGESRELNLLDAFCTSKNING